MRDLGWDMQLTAVRLAEFNSVTNAYLSIFMVLGALGLLLGTFGLVVVLSRSILERKQEIALLKAVGYPRMEIRKLVIREYMFLLPGESVQGFAYSHYCHPALHPECTYRHLFLHHPDLAGRPGGERLVLDSPGDFIIAEKSIIFMKD